MEMKVSIQRVGKDLQFDAQNPNGNVVRIDGGSEKSGMRPMELLLTAMGSCSAFDAVLILEKQRQVVNDFSVEVVGQRPEEGAAKPYESIHLNFKLSGEVDPDKTQRALSLAVDKYCSVSATFRPETKITFDFEIFETT